MSSPRPRVKDALVRTAARGGGSRPTEDRIFRTDTAVILLDGASQPDRSSLDGGWYAETLGRTLRDHLVTRPDEDLTTLLAAGISAVAREFQLRAGASPSATVSVVRWDERTVDVAVLGDSPVIARTRTGEVLLVRDDRLRHVARPQRRRLAAADGFLSAHPEQWRALVDAELAARNQPGGYWIAEADPNAATQARRQQWDRGAVTAMLVMSDGVSAGVDRYGVPPDWPTAFAIAEDDVGRLVDLVHDAEASDPEGKRWSRSKRHDDKSLAFIDLASAKQ